MSAVAPDQLAGGRVQGDGLAVERVEEDLPVGADEAPRPGPSAGPLRDQLQFVQLGPELPLDESVAREIHGVHAVRLRRYEVHRVGHDERRRLMRVEDREREGPDNPSLVRLSDRLGRPTAAPRRGPVRRPDGTTAPLPRNPGARHGLPGT